MYVLKSSRKIKVAKLNERCFVPLMIEEINFVMESALTKHNFHQRISFAILTDFNEISCSPTPFSQIFPFEFLPHAKPTPVFHLIAKN